MHNILRVLKRDIIRLLKAPAALVVVGALILLPSLYTWFNVIGFWNPYDNTGNLRVCIVNEDAGAENDLMGTLDVGSQIIESLEENDQLGWEFVDRDTAQEEVLSGQAYAAFIIPENFSYCFTTLLDEDRQQPTLEYYVNEKNGAVAPKITDTGATTLDETINETFVSTASEVIADALDTALEDASERSSSSQASSSEKLSGSIRAAEQAQQSVDDLDARIGEAIDEASSIKPAIESVKDDITLAAQSLEDASNLTAQTQESLAEFWYSSGAILDESSALASQASAKTNEAIAKSSSSLIRAQARVDAALANGQGAIDQTQAAIAQLRSLLQVLPEGDSARQRIEAQIASLESLLNDLDTALASLRVVDADISDAARTSSALAEAVNETVQATLRATNEFRATMSESVVPALTQSVTQITDATNALSSTIASQTALIDQTQSVIDQFSATLASARPAIGGSKALLGNLESGLRTVRADISALNASDAISDLVGEDGLNATRLSEFMRSPTKITTESPYHLDSYGSAMAPLFTNLTLWIGVFMLLVILKQEVDDEGIRNLTVRQRYAARLLLLAPMAALQAIVCCIGNLIIGVQTVNAPLYFITAIIISLSFLSLQYMLAVTMQHLGKGICIALVFAQIPGATGLYPIEMTPQFFQVVYPLFPFTYGINAMRETIAGMYAGQWAASIGVLIGFLVATLLIGLIATPYLTNLNRMFARQIRESNIMNGEDGQIPERRFRLQLIIQLLSDNDEYRERIRARADKFFQLYPLLKRATLVAGIAVPALTTTILALAGLDKITILTSWLIWLLVVIVFLILLEHAHNSIERQLSLGDLSEGELRGMFLPRSRRRARMKGGE